MKLSELKETLVRLKSTRMLSMEAQAALDPFRDQVLHVGASFRSASQTHSTQLGSAYNGGYTVIGSIDDGDLEISALLWPSENEHVEALREGQILEMPLGVLDYDALYQRVIFGQLAEEQDSILQPTPEPTPEPEPISEPATITVVPMEAPSEPAPELPPRVAP